MTPLFYAFISSGRADSKAFAQNLQSRFTEQGLNVWFNFNDIPLAVDLQNQIKEDDYRLDESQLLRILHQDEAYYREHKILRLFRT